MSSIEQVHDIAAASPVKDSDKPKSSDVDSGPSGDIESSIPLNPTDTLRRERWEFKHALKKEENRVRLLEEELRQAKDLMDLRVRETEAASKSLTEMTARFELLANDKEHRDKEVEAELREKDIVIGRTEDQLEVELKEKNLVIDGAKNQLEVIQDSLNCCVCFSHLQDPHLLQCGHTACRECLVNWFRTPYAYAHPEPITDTANPYVIAADAAIEYRSKVCSQCRSNIVIRPIPVRALSAILSAVDIPLAPDAPDAWLGMFPPLQEMYRWAPGDEINYRCTSCGEEVDQEGACAGCSIVYSPTSEDEEFEEDDRGGGAGDIM